MALPVIGDGDREFGVGAVGAQHVAGVGDDRRGARLAPDEGDVMVLVDLGHRARLLGRQFAQAEVEAAVARVERQGADEVAFGGRVLRMHRHQIDAAAVGEGDRGGAWSVR